MECTWLKRTAELSSTNLRVPASGLVIIAPIVVRTAQLACQSHDLLQRISGPCKAKLTWWRFLSPICAAKPCQPLHMHIQLIQAAA